MINNLNTSFTQSKSSESYKTAKINRQTLWCIIIIFQEDKNQHKTIHKSVGVHLPSATASKTSNQSSCSR